MRRIKTILQSGVVAELNGQYWGIQGLAEAGFSTMERFGFGPIEKAKMYDPKYCTNTADLIYPETPPEWVAHLAVAAIKHMTILTMYYVED